MLRERPMLMSAPMVRALLEGRKTQTRRIVANVQGIGSVTEFQPSDTIGYDWIMRDRRMLWNDFSTADLLARAPHPVGSEIWVRETWAHVPIANDDGGQGDKMGAIYRADGAAAFDSMPAEWEFLGKWRSPRFMPRWASRIILKVTDVRVQRLQDISEEDADAEGVEIDVWDQAIVSRNYAIEDREASGAWFQSWRPDCGPIYVDVEEVARASYRSLWESINGPGSWDANPWVWAYTFEVKK